MNRNYQYKGATWCYNTELLCQRHTQPLQFTTHIHKTSPIPFVNCKQKAGWNMTHQKLFPYAVVLIDTFIIYSIMPQSAMTSLQFSI